MRLSVCWGRAACCARGRRATWLMVLLVVLLVFQVPSGPAAREIATREPAARSGRSRLIGQVVLVFGLSFVATKPKGGGWTRCDLSSWLARSCWFYPGF